MGVCRLHFTLSLFEGFLFLAFHLLYVYACTINRPDTI